MSSQVKQYNIYSLSPDPFLLYKKPPKVKKTTRTKVLGKRLTHRQSSSIENAWSCLAHTWKRSIFATSQNASFEYRCHFLWSRGRMCRANNPLPQIHTIIRDPYTRKSKSAETKVSSCRTKEPYRHGRVVC